MQLDYVIGKLKQPIYTKSTQPNPLITITTNPEKKLRNFPNVEIFFNILEIFDLNVVVFGNCKGYD